MWNKCYEYKKYERWRRTFDDKGVDYRKNQSLKNLDFMTKNLEYRYLRTNHNLRYLSKIMYLRDSFMYTQKFSKCNL